jgi:broad specificity phosphatase PhoE
MPDLISCLRAKPGCAAIMLCLCCQGAAAETIVLVRHGEKPDGGLGQLTCQGLNRSLALPAVLVKKFGRPAAIFAPNPGIVKKDQGREYNYIRPLATIEPTAIRLGMPVNTHWGYDDIRSLEDDLLDTSLRDGTVFVAWEHRLLADIAKDLLKRYGGNPRNVPHWDGSDFDSIYVVEIPNTGGRGKTATFRIEHQGLNGLNAACPGE